MEYFIGGYYNGGADQKQTGEHFRVDDLLDFPNDDDVLMSDGLFDNISKADSSTFASNDTSNSSFGNYHTFSSELCVPNDDLAELEWLSSFVEDSFSTDQSLQTNVRLLSGSKPHTPESSSSDTIQPEQMARNTAIFQPEIPLPGKARSKRSRAAPGDWTTRLLHLSPSEKGGSKKNSSSNSNSKNDHVIRKCLHCATEKTPQWRTGPMGPKTLCNACGVRFKSGRLVPEYRPAASPTFISAKHSNSHRKVLELRRQKDMQRAQHEQFLSEASIFGVSNGGDDFLIHRHGGSNFRRMI